MNLVILELQQELIRSKLKKDTIFMAAPVTKEAPSGPSPRTLLSDLIKLEGNNACADCGEPSPGWASVNLGVLICTQCAGVHRSLGVEKSFVLSLSLDDWTREQVKGMLEKGGNAKINKILEYCIPKVFEVPQGSKTSRNEREQFIIAKYINELFKFREGKSGSPHYPKRVVRPSPPHSPSSPRSRSSSGGSSNDIRNVAMVEFKGIVHLRLVEARKLIEKDIVKSDPYFVMSVGLQKQKSTVKKRTLNPKYNESFQFSWDSNDKLFIEVYDKDTLTKDDHMGLAEIDMSSMLDGECEMKGWYPITHRNHKNRQQGEVYIELLYHSIQ
jgi:stromal membrane-associated protein